MRAVAELHRELEQKGFVFVQDRYRGRLSQISLVGELKLDLADETLEAIDVQLQLYYPFQKYGAGLMPPELSYLRADGHVWYPPTRDESELYISKNRLAHLIRESALGWFRFMSDAEIAIGMLDYQMGGDSVPHEFSYLRDAPSELKRRRTIVLLRAKAAFLNCAQRFGEAENVLRSAEMKPAINGPFEQKLLADAVARKINDDSIRATYPAIAV